VPCGSGTRHIGLVPKPKEAFTVIRNLARALVLSIVLLSLGCHKDNVTGVPVDSPPHTVDGVYSVTGDGQVTIYWRANQESDIAYYKVYRNIAATGTFTLVGSTPQTSFVDTGVANGNSSWKR